MKMTGNPNILDMPLPFPLFKTPKKILYILTSKLQRKYCTLISYLNVKSPSAGILSLKSTNYYRLKHSVKFQMIEVLSSPLEKLVS